MTLFEELTGFFSFIAWSLSMRKSIGFNGRSLINLDFKS